METFFKSLGSRRKFFDGMKTVRNGVFHVRSLRSWRSRNIRFFGEICDECGGILTVMSELHRLLYDFTGKVFSGELRIWPDFIYEDWDRLERERPELIGKLETGNVDILEVIDAMDSWAHPL
ncbi:MAG: hypothetical protein F4Z35_01520 [Dehalococcoidia bacterium]|nr:hypothetical protein [Dehalococcoidia bacterium]